MAHVAGNVVQSNLVRTNFKGLNTFVCLIGSSSYPDLTKNRYAYHMDCIYMYVKVHAGVHGKHVILSISQKQVSTMTKCNESRLCRKFVQRTDYFVKNTLENNLHCTYNMTSTIENKEEKRQPAHAHARGPKVCTTCT